MAVRINLRINKIAVRIYFTPLIADLKMAVRINFTSCSYLSFLRRFLRSFIRSFGPFFVPFQIPSFLLRSFVDSFVALSLPSFVPSQLCSFEDSFPRSFLGCFVASSVHPFRQRIPKARYTHSVLTYRRVQQVPCSLLLLSWSLNRKYKY